MSDININIRLASKAAENGLKTFGAAATGAQKRLTLFEKATRQVNRSLDSFVGNLGANLAFRAFNGIIRGIGATITNFRDFEQALVGVGKTTGLSGKDLDDLGASIEDLSRRIPVASTELLDLARVGAQLGIRGTENIEKFTETLARLSVATDIVGEQGAISFARIINVTGESVQNIDRLGASIVELGNNFATTESQILNVANEVAKGGGRFGVTAEEALALSTTMSSLGAEAQVAGSTIQKTFSLIEKAIGDAGPQLDKFAGLLELNTEEFINLFETDPTELFIRLNEGLGRAVDGGANLSKTLASLGLVDLRVTKTLGPLITRTDELRRAQELSTTAYAENEALLTESEAAFDTLNSNLQELSNNWTILTNALVESVVPAFNATIELLNGLIDALRENADDLKTTAKIFGIAALAVAPFVIGMVAATLATTVFGPAIAAAGLAFAGYTSTTVAATAATATFWAVLLGPYTLVALGIAAVGAAVFAMVKYWDQIVLKIKEFILLSGNLFGIENERLESEVGLLRKQIRLQEESNKKKKDALDIAEDASELDQARAEQRAFRGGGGVSSTEAGKTESEQAQARREQRLADQAKALEDEAEFQKKLREIQNEAKALDEEVRLLEIGEEELRKQDKFVALEEQLGTEEAIRQQAILNTLDNEKDKELQLAKIARDASKKRVKDLQEADEQEKKLAQATANAKVNILQSAASLITAVTKDGSKAAFLAQKAAALASAIVSKEQAAAQALAVPPAPNLALSGLARTAGNISIAAIIASAVKGFQDGGVVGGDSFSGDNVLARVNSGEMILNREQQAQLFDQANGASPAGGGGGDIVVQIDGEEVFRAVSRQVANGGVLGEGGV